MTHYDFDKDYKEAEKAEEEVLKIIQKKYPRSHRIKGDFKGFDIYCPEADQRIEVKRDFLACKTGNYFIETKYGGEESGINTTESDFYVLVDDEIIIWITTHVLKYLLRDLRESTFPAKGKDKARTGKLIKRDSLIHSPFAVCYKRKK